MVALVFASARSSLVERMAPYDTEISFRPLATLGSKDIETRTINTSTAISQGKLASREERLLPLEYPRGEGYASLFQWRGWVFSPTQLVALVCRSCHSLLGFRCLLSTTWNPLPSRSSSHTKALSAFSALFFESFLLQHLSNSFQQTSEDLLCCFAVTALSYCGSLHFRVAGWVGERVDAPY